MKRVLLKISWESLCDGEIKISPEKAENVAHMISEIKNLWVEIVIVVWGGNIYRGSNLIASGVNGADSHNMSMLSTVFNAVTLKNFLSKIDIKCEVLDALWIEFLERYTQNSARKYLEEGTIVIASSGSGNPFFTTDSAWALRAAELGCEAMIKLTKVDGVYDSDPLKNPNAKKYDALSYKQVLDEDLKILDGTAVILARDNNIPMYVTKLDDLDAVKAIVEWNHAGTKIS